MVDDDEYQDLQLWLLLAHLICGIVGYVAINALGSLMLRSLMGTAGVM